MTRLEREFNTAEKPLLLILGLILVAGVYYQFVFVPIVRELESARSQRDALEMELTSVQMRIAQLSRMQEEIAELDYSSQSTRMESYNDSSAELALLNNILRDAEQYSIAFDDLTQDGEMVRRSFTLQFTTDDLETAEFILTRLTNSGRRCLVGDMSCSMENRGDDETVVNVGLFATFYETMADGTPDAGLPAAAVSAS